MMYLPAATAQTGLQQNKKENMEYGHIGEKLGHSFSKEIHNQIGSYDYILKEIPKNILED